MVRAMRNGAVIGAVVGASVAIVVIILITVRHSPWQVSDVLVERLTFLLCPFFVLAFVESMGSMARLIVITIVGNALLYAATFGVIAAFVSLFKRIHAWL
jgi:hypothetical protein